eukprot:TRINITY_DN11971_c0_g2_i1.p1 TRINITY_DN11971_c0_g2~~TRINITY_DN11971_c0_g2_i1.p1  ORF type:complete len:469 (+),score=105.72 TRINITY_DN11971_c0_g2_i1:323-1729(+)
MMIVDLRLDSAQLDSALLELDDDFLEVVSAATLEGAAEALELLADAHSPRSQEGYEYYQVISRMRIKLQHLVLFLFLSSAFSINYVVFKQCDERWSDYAFEYLSTTTTRERTSASTGPAVIMKRGRICEDIQQGSRFATFAAVASTFEKTCGTERLCFPTDFITGLRASNSMSDHLYFESLGFQFEGSVERDIVAIRSKLVQGRILLSSADPKHQQIIITGIDGDHTVNVIDPYDPKQKVYPVVALGRITVYRNLAKGEKPAPNPVTPTRKEVVTESFFCNSLIASISQELEALTITEPKLGVPHYLTEALKDASAPCFSRCGTELNILTSLTRGTDQKQFKDNVAILKREFYALVDDCLKVDPLKDQHEAYTHWREIDARYESLAEDPYNKERATRYVTAIRKAFAELEDVIVGAGQDFSTLGNIPELKQQADTLDASNEVELTTYARTLKQSQKLLYLYVFMESIF